MLVIFFNIKQLPIYLYIIMMLSSVNFGDLKKNCGIYYIIHSNKQINISDYL